MYYPANFPKSKEKVLKKLFLFLEKKNPRTRKEVSKQIKNFLKGKSLSGFYPSFWMINFIWWRHFARNGQPPPFLKLLQKTKTRSLSGIVPLSLFTKPEGSCPYHCLYCPKQDGAPKSYFPDEAAVMRAIRNKYDPFRQTQSRLIQFFLSGHPVDKIDVIIQGGTFSSYSKSYRQEFVKEIYNACNLDIETLVRKGRVDFKRAKSLKKAKSQNEKAPQRVIGLTVETRPDLIDKEEIIFLRKLGVTRVELGVQTLDEEALRLIKRGHGVKEIVLATKLLKEAGFKVAYHLMPGLPGSTLKKDIRVLKKVFKDERFKPDYLKFYPTQVVWGSELLDWHKNGKYKPFSKKELITLLKIFKKEIAPLWVRIQRVVRDLTRRDVAAQTFPSNFRQIAREELEKEGIFCPCIRCREIRGQKVAGRVKIETISYSASGGKEFFIQGVDQKNRLLGFLRLRIPEHVFSKKDFFIKELRGAGLVRDLHVYGPQVSLGKKGEVQHRGLGKRLLQKAERIRKSLGVKKLAVISGVGVRDYYRDLGFCLGGKGEYMIKNK